MLKIRVLVHAWTCTQHTETKSQSSRLLCALNSSRLVSFSLSLESAGRRCNGEHYTALLWIMQFVNYFTIISLFHCVWDFKEAVLCVQYILALLMSCWYLLELHIKSCRKCREYSVFSSRRLVRSSHMTRDLLTTMITATILLYSHINTNAGKSYCASCPLTHSSGTFGIPQIHKLPFCSN